MSARLAPPPLPKGGERYGAWWDERSAQAACAFFPRYLVHTEGEWAGRPFHLADWQRDRIIRPVFGWKRADGTRLIRVVWIEVPRKNGKTELAAGISLLALVADGEFGGQVYSLATDKDQAKLVFNKAGVMGSASEELRKELEVFKTAIVVPSLQASFKPLSGVPTGKHGFSTSAAIGDEVHEWPDGELADVVHKSTAARRQPLEVYITTAGLQGVGFAWEQHEHAVAVLRGEVEDPTFLPVVFAAEPEDDWQSEATWRKANPNYGISPKAEYMREEARKAARSPREENSFKRFHLNLWTEQVTRWLPMGKDGGWDGCTEDLADKQLWTKLPDRMKGRQVTGGLDLASNNDLTALCWYLPAEEEGQRGLYTWRFWLPRRTLEGLPSPALRRYEAWIQAGALEITDGNVVDFGLIREAILSDAERMEILNLGIDRWGAVQLATELKGEGVPVHFFGQGFKSMSVPTRHFEHQVLSGEMEHGNNPVARWMAGNAAVEQDAAGGMKPSKVKAAQKIDGIVAAVMALGLTIGVEEPQSGMTESGELLVLD